MFGATKKGTFLKSCLPLTSHPGLEMRWFNSPDDLYRMKGMITYFSQSNHYSNQQISTHDDLIEIHHSNT